MRLQKILASFALLGLAALPTTGCKRHAAGAGGITVAGSTSVQPFAEKWAEAFHAAHPNVEIAVQGGGSTAGIQAALSGAAQIGASSRSLHPDEASQLKQFEVARDGIAVVVHPSNPVTSLTLDQIRGIYAGEIQNWKDVGGPDKKITVITREEGSGTRGAFEELAMKDKKIASSDLVQDSTGAVHQMVSSDPAAIGFISLAQMSSNVKGVAIGGVSPSEANIDAGTYPLVRPFLFLTKQPPTGNVKAFIDFVQGPTGKELTRKEGLLPPK